MSLDELPDSDLELRAAQGDREAFALLYERHCDVVHDFIYRTIRNEFDAADLTQETFVRAMSALNADRAGGNLRAWLLTIARNTTLNWLDKRKREAPPPAARGDDEADIFTRIEAKEDDDPETAAQIHEAAALVWEAAQALEPRQRTILELHIRHGLDSAEIADVLGVTKGNAYTMLSRLKDTFESAVTSVMMLRIGSRRCSALAGLLSQRAASELSPASRRMIDRHIDGCIICQGQKRLLVSPSMLLRGLVLVPLPLALRRRGMEAAWEAISASKQAAPFTGAGEARFTPRGRDNGDHDSGATPRAGDDGDSGFLRRALRAAVAGLLVLLLTGAGVAMALNGGSRHEKVLRGALRPHTQPTVLGYYVAPTESPAPFTETVTPTPTPRAPTTATPTRTVTHTSIATSTVAAAPRVSLSCDGFWERQPSTGAGWSEEYAAILVAIQNDDRARLGLPPLVDSPAIRAVAAEYAVFVFENRWWAVAPDKHRGADGRYIDDRLRDAGVIGTYAHEQSVGPPGRSWVRAAENVAGSDNGWTPCDMSSNWSGCHWNNARGVVPDSPDTCDGPFSRDVYQGTACYIAYSSRAVACVQDFLIFREP